MQSNKQQNVNKTYDRQINENKHLKLTDRQTNKTC